MHSYNGSTWAGFTPPAPSLNFSSALLTVTSAGSDEYSRHRPGTQPGAATPPGNPAVRTQTGAGGTDLHLHPAAYKAAALLFELHRQNTGVLQMCSRTPRFAVAYGLPFNGQTDPSRDGAKPSPHTFRIVKEQSPLRAFLRGNKKTPLRNA